MHVQKLGACCVQTQQARRRRGSSRRTARALHPHTWLRTHHTRMHASARGAQEGREITGVTRSKTQTALQLHAPACAAPRPFGQLQRPWQACSPHTPRALRKAPLPAVPPGHCACAPNTRAPPRGHRTRERPAQACAWGRAAKARQQHGRRKRRTAACTRRHTPASGACCTTTMGSAQRRP